MFASTPTPAHDQTETSAAYRLGDVDAEGRYPVTADGRTIGHVARWHGRWRATTA